MRKLWESCEKVCVKKVVRKWWESYEKIVRKSSENGQKFLRESSETEGSTLPEISIGL